jgi:GT2 family glycosyltransferase
MKVLLGIPTTNLWNKYTKAALESIKKNGDYQLTVILLDNASTDETKQEGPFFKSDQYEYVCFRNEKRISCAGSWNLIAKYGMENDFDLIGIFNDDVLFNKNTVDNLVKRFQEEQSEPREREAVLISSQNLRGELSDDPRKILEYVDERGPVAEAEHPDYSGFMISRKLIDIVGYFDDLNFFPVYFEDNDSHYRINLAGLRAIVYPGSVYYHFGSATGVGQGVSTGASFERNRQTYIKKWGGTPGEEKFTSPFNK